MASPYDAAPQPLRQDLRAALNRNHERLAQPGYWLDGGQRLAVVAEARHAPDCALCQARAEAISPYAVSGAHDSLGQLPGAWVDVIHRVAMDSGRLSARWYDEARRGGMLEDEIIEVISVAVQAVVIDSFTAGIGMDSPALPPPSPGQPARHHRAEARTGPGWAKTIAPEDAGPDFADFYDNDSNFYIRRSLTLVPEETRRLWDLLNHLYLEDPRLHELDGMERDISRAQMEFLAARASALLGCYY
jgi:hypothetical protein